MSKFTVFVLIIMLRLFYQPATNQYSAPFASPAPQTTLSATFLSFNGSLKNHRVFLEWKVSENETADCFQVEKSTDGASYSLVALVFGTDKLHTDTYPYYETLDKQKTFYRIKLISKNKQITYSRSLTIIPAA